VKGRRQLISVIVASLDPHRDCDWFRDLPSLRAINHRMPAGEPRVGRRQVSAAAPRCSRARARAAARSKDLHITARREVGYARR